jgi:hypothetical protein
MSEKENYLNEMEGFLNNPFDKKLEVAFFAELAQLESALPYLRMTLEQDLKRHFNSDTPMSQFQVKGAYSRTHHLLMGILAAKGGGKKKDITPDKRRMK